MSKEKLIAGGHHSGRLPTSPPLWEGTVRGITHEEQPFEFRGDFDVIQAFVENVSVSAVVAFGGELSAKEVLLVGRTARLAYNEAIPSDLSPDAGYCVTVRRYGGKVRPRAVEIEKRSVGLRTWLEQQVQIKRTPRVDTRVLKVLVLGAGSHTKTEEDSPPTSVLPKAIPEDLHERYRLAREALVQRYGPLYSSRKLHELLHSTAQNKYLVAQRLLAARDVFFVEHGGDRGFFPFQFDATTGKPLPVIGQIVRAFPDGTDGWRIAFWLTSPNGKLAGKAPLDLLGDSKSHGLLLKIVEAEDAIEPF